MFLILSAQSKCLLYVQDDDLPYLEIMDDAHPMTPHGPHDPYLEVSDSPYQLELQALGRHTDHVGEEDHYDVVYTGQAMIPACKWCGFILF